MLVAVVGVLLASVVLVVLVRRRWPPLDVLHTHAFRVSPWILRALRCRSYAQHGQDLAVLGMLGNGPGYFVELGASNGVTSSNTLLLEARHGWRGVCIEADPWFFGQLRRHRRCRCVQACIDGIEQDIVFTPAGATGGIVDSNTDNGTPKARAGAITMRTRRLAEVLEEAGAPPVIDYLSLDVEGAESRILGSFPFERWRFRILMIERVRPPLHAQLEAKGYRRLGRLGQDDVYAHEDEPFADAWRAFEASPHGA